MSEGLSEARRPAAAILDEIAADVMGVDPQDRAGVQRLLEKLEELGAAAADDGALRLEVVACVGRLSASLQAGGDEVAAALDAACEATARMQDAIAAAARAAAAAAPAPEPAVARAAPAPAAAPPAPQPLKLPEWGDARTLADFVAAQKPLLDEMESLVLAVEKEDGSARTVLRGRLHTLKGEAGALGLADVEAVCHAAEDLLEPGCAGRDVADRLLRVRDWLGAAVAAASRLQRPQVTADDVIASLREPPVAAERVERDAETVGLFGEFLSESAEGLTQVDQILMNAERDGVDPETVNSLFRVFHTIKGTAGFLELDHVVALAHTTESMMNRCREGALVLRGAVIDLVFDATAAMREMLDGIRGGLEAGTAFPAGRDLSRLLRRMEEATEGRAVAEKEVPVAGRGEKLGEVLTRPPLEVPPAVIAQAVAAQEQSGRRLGEELVATGAVQPAQIAHALRAQARSAAGEGEAPVKLRETIKVDLERVDSLIEMIGELVVVESMVVNAPEITQHSSVRVRNCLGQLAKVTRDLQDVGMRMRMVPVAGVFQKMARLVRDLSRKSGKEVRLVTAGESTEMDRSMVEQVADPLVHMIRNSMDHGLEGPDERRRAGKAPEGSLRLSAYHEGGSVVIEIADDGRGLDRDRIARKAIEKGLIPSADGLSDAEIHALIFAPGFSTAAQVTEISGRGVGMDVVKRNVEAMRGRVLIESTPGAGTTFKIVLPLTLAIIDGMLVACGADRYIVPTLSIVESIQPEADMLVSLAGTNEMINLRGEILPLLRMDRLLQIEGAKADPTEALVVIVEGVGRRVGLLVDEVVAQQQVVIKTLGAGFRQTPFVSGAAILADGRVGLILNVEEIAGLVGRRAHGLACDPAAAPPRAAPAAEEVRA
jgi:two-component system chemotaxis sensor kinase CheA